MAMDKSILAINDRLDRIEALLRQVLASKPAVDVAKVVKDAVAAALREMASEPKTLPRGEPVIQVGERTATKK